VLIMLFCSNTMPVVPVSMLSFLKSKMNQEYPYVLFLLSEAPISINDGATSIHIQIFSHAGFFDHNF